MVFHISKAVKNDAAELSYLVNSAYRGDSSRKGWTTEADLLDGTRTTPELLEETLEKEDTTILKYMEGGKILGCVELRLDVNRLYLGMLTVSPTLQGKGIGKIMLDASEAEAKKQGCGAIYMTVISVRKELIEWYKRRGYQETGHRKPFVVPDKRWGIPKLNMEFIFLEKLIVN